MNERKRGRKLKAGKVVSLKAAMDRAEAQRRAMQENAPKPGMSREEIRDWWFGRGQQRQDRLPQRVREAEIRFQLERIRKERESVPQKIAA
jgi:hypothetical protein